MKIFRYKVQDFLQGFADAMAFTFILLTFAWDHTPVPWEIPMYAAGYGFAAYTMKRWLDITDKLLLNQSDTQNEVSS